MEGAWRYLNKLWRALLERRDILAADVALRPPGGALPEGALTLRRQVHQTIAAVSADIEHYHFNKAVARIRELSNALLAFAVQDEAGRFVFREGAEALIHLLGPLLPHFAEELWSQLGHTDLIAERPWPVADASLLVEDTVTVAVQVLGKLRGTLELTRGTSREEMEKAALALPKVQEFIAGKSIAKIIVVPDKVVNVVVK